MKLPTITISSTWLQYALANTVIIVLLPLLTLQGMPPVDWAWSWLRRPQSDADVGEFEEQTQQDPVANQIAAWTGPALDITGTWSGPWWMFAPNPDSTNHRVRAEIEYRDGRQVLWRSPEWPELSCWRRFRLSRELEYLDSLGGIPDRSPDKLALWSVFAERLARQHRENSEAEGGPHSVRIIVEEAVIANPLDEGWQPMSQLYPRDDERVVMTRRYPLLPKMPDQNASPVPGGAP